MNQQNKHPLRLRSWGSSGALLVREAINLTFYMRHPHQEVAPAVLRSLERYRRVVGNGVLCQYLHESGYWEELDEAAWEALTHEMLRERTAIIDLIEMASRERRYQFEYRGFLTDTPEDDPKSVCAVSFWLPTEYLEEHGPAHVRELALELAAPLPFCSGHAGLAFNTDHDVLGLEGEPSTWLSRHPGVDVLQLGRVVMQLGTRVRSASWLTFLGPPVLGELGGVAGLQARLSSQDIRVQGLEGERAVITVSEWPEPGEEGHMPPSYRELARVLEPWLYHERYLLNPWYTEEGLRRWERRFLEETT
jgi:hypothetical protein